MAHPSESDLAALERFVVENDDLLELEATIGRFNIFDALRIERAEIRHSNFLAWLLTPSESHGQGDLFLKAVLMDVLRLAPPSKRPLSPVALDGEELHDVGVRREYRNIDLMVICGHPRFVVVVENKVESGERPEQLKKYEDTARKDLPGEPSMFIFLSPDGRPASRDNWVAYSYGDLHRVLTRVQRTAGGSLGGDVDVFLQHYLQMIGSRMMDDPKLDELCARIYANHRRAIDLIVEKMPVAGSAATLAVNAWLQAQAGEWVYRNAGARRVNMIPRSWVGTLSLADGERHPDAPCDLYVELRCGRTTIAARVVVGRSDRQEARVAVIERITANTGLRMHRKEISSNWTRLGSQTLLRWDEENEPEEADVQKALDRYFESVTPFLSQFPELLRQVTRS